MRTHYSNEITKSMIGKKVTVAGWLSEIRSFGGIKFLVIRDRKGNTQITVKKDSKFSSMVDSLTKECILSVSGAVQQMKGDDNRIELLPDEIKIINNAESPLPLDISGKIESDLDSRLNERFADLRRHDIRAIFMIKNELLCGIRDYFDENGFVEVHTPKIVSAGAEGGSSLFSLDYFGKKAYLAQSPQLFKQTLMATGLDRVYEISPAFRAEKSETTRHISEFVSFDAELAFIDSMEDVLKVLEESVVSALQHIQKHANSELDYLKIKINAPKLPIPRITYSEAVKLLSAEGVKIKEGDDIDTETEKALGAIMEKKGHEFYYVIDYPEKIKPFYIMEKGEYSESFDLMYKGYELASGGQREHRYEHLVARMKKLNLKPENFVFYLKGFKYGMPPHGGWGLGVERFVQKILALSNIRETVLFPRDMKRLIP
jgi:nondiscriminating aspartyl-tRNA synthetase